MEIIETAGLRIFLDSRDVHRGSAWSSVADAGLWFGSLLRGRIVVKHPGRERRTLTGRSCVQFWAGAPLQTHHLALVDGEVAGVFVQIRPDNVDAIVGSDRLSKAASGSLGPDFGAHAHLDGVVALTRAVAWQMLGCTLTGNSRRLYLTGKGLEMIALLLALEAEGSATAKSTLQSPLALVSRQWSPRDIECFHHARAILLSRLRDPPTVPELAREAGLNARKLSEGFVDLFGSSVYSFVKARRLEGARLMLEAGETSIARVAYAFGYQPGHLATAFRQRFGISPTELTGRRAASANVTPA